jgi:predicted dehydrogenase
LRVVQVGMGFWGRDWARLVAPAVGEVEMVGFVDSDPAALAILQRDLAVPPRCCFSSFAEALEVVEADAALVTTTLPGHEPVSRSALDRGLHVLVEKPFTDSLEAARELVDLASSRNLKLMVSQNYRFFPAVRTAARLVREGQLGPLYEVAIDFRHNDPSPPFPRRRHHGDTHPLLVDMSIHHFDLLRFMLGSEPLALRCEASNPAWSGYQGPPAAVCSMLFPGDVIVSYRGSWISAGPETAWAGEWRMEFERGQLFFTSRGEDNQLMDRVVLRSRRGRPRSVPLPTMARIDRAGALTEFAKAVREGREAETSGRDNLGTIAFMLAVVESAQRGEAVRLPETQAPPAS